MSENRVVITGDANQAIAEYERLYVAGVGSMQRLASAGDVFLRAVGTSTARHASDLAAVPAQLAAIGDHYDRLRVSATASLQQVASAGNSAFRNINSSSTQLAAVSNEFARVRDTGTTALQQLESAGTRSLRQLAAAGTSTARTVGLTAGQQAQALQQLPMQVMDIVVSLQAGQAPLTVLLQQGGQLAGSFGSAGAAARALGSYALGLVNPYTVLAAAAAAVAVAYHQGSKEADAYRQSLVSTGGAAGATVGQLSDAARDISKAVGTKAAAAEAVAALAGTGQVGVENLRQFGQEAVEAQRLLGKSIDDTVKDYAELGKAPVQASEKLNEQYHYLTASTYAQISALERQGRTEEAGELAQKTYATAMSGRTAEIKANLGLMERAWQGVTDWAKKGWDAMLDIGRSDSLGDKLEKANERLEKAKRARYTFAGGGADGKAELDAAQKSVDLLTKQTAAEATSAKAKADKQKAEEALTAWQKEGVQYLSKQKQLEEEIVAIRNKGKAAGASSSEINDRIKQVTQKKYGELNNAPLAALEAQRNLEKEVLAGRLADLDSNHRQRLVGEQEYIVAKRDLQLQELAGEIKVAQKQAELAGGKADLAERAKYLGALAVLQQRRKNIIAQADDATAELATGPAKDLKVKGDGWERATAGEQANLREEIALYGQAAEARKIAAAQTRVQVEAQQLLDAWAEKGHVATKEEKDDLAALVATRQKNVGAIMGEQQALAGAEQLRAQNERYAAEALGDPRARAQALLDGEAKVWHERIQLADEGTEAQKKLQSEFNTWYANQSQKVLLDVDVTRATELLKIVEAVDESTKSAAAGMAASFGRVGAAVGGLTTALSGYARTQAAIAAQLTSATKAAGGDTTKIAQANALAAQQSAQAQVKSYGDMAGAAKGFFKENSAGYKVLQGTEKAFRAYEMVMAVENMVAKSGLLAEFTALFVASKATETAAEGASTGASVGMAGAQASAWGVTAVVKAIASMPFPANLVAGAATLAAVVAIGAKIAGSVGGGGADTTAQDRQKAAGTGSILGDGSAKSDSIARSLELAAANSSIELTHTAGMLASLRNIESSIAGLGNLLVRTSGLTGELAPNSKGAAYALGSSTAVTAVLGGVVGVVLDKITGGLVGKITGTILGSIFGGKVTTLDTGVTVGKTSLGSALAGGVQASQYTDTKKDGGWFSSDKYNTQLSSLGAEADDQFTKVIRGLAASVSEAGNLLGVGGDAFTQHLNAFVVDIGKISLKGLTGDEIQKQLETVFAKQGDDLAKFAVAGLDEFQKVGEGYFETLTRVASNYANLDSILAASGATFGATGIASIAARERLIDLTGGIGELARKSSSFNDNFLSEAERLAPVQKYVTEQLAAMGLAGLDTRDKYKETVLGLASSGALATEAGAKQYAGLLDLADAFAKVYATTADVTKSQQAIADERADLMDRLNAATKTNVELLALEKAGKDASNQALFDQVIAAEKAQAAAQRLADTNAAIQSDIDGLVKASLPLAAQRALEVAGMDASTLALYERREALQAEAKALAEAKAAQEAAATKRASIELTIAQLLGNTALARERELAALPAAVRGLQAYANALADADQAVTASLSGVQRAVDAEKATIQADAETRVAAIRAGMDAAQTALTSAQKSVDSLRGIFDDISGAVKSLRSSVNGQANVVQAKSFIDMALVLARSGAMPDADKLRDAISTVTQDRREAYASSADFQFAQLVQAGKLEALGSLAGAQKTLAEQQFDALTSANKLADEQIKAIEKAAADQTKALDTQWKAAQDAVSAMRGVDLSVKSVGAAIQGLNSTLAALAATRAGASAATGISGTLPTSSAPVGGGASAPAASQGGSAAAVPAGGQKALTAAQQAYFDAIKSNAGDVAEKYEYVAGLQDVQAMKSLDAVKGVANDPAESSDDYMLRHGYKVNALASDYKTRYVPAFAGGGDHAGGLRVVGERGIEIEATGPSRIWNFEQTRRMLSGGGNSEEVTALVRMLREQNGRLEAQNKRLEDQLSGIGDSTRRTRDLLDQLTSGGNSMRCDVVKSVAVAG